MKLYADKRFQIGLTVLYPILIGLFFVTMQSAFWLLAVLAMLIYCALWKNIGYVLLSNLLLLLLSIGLWVTDVDYMQMGSVRETRVWLPFSYLLYGAFCLIPPLVLVPLRNLLAKKDRQRHT
ncbi:hypothetical protein [Saccharibacillus sacchari]|uniref:Uncharacterized protein n=1 Tax=Saccharibacillus sacchari TaxID=456493 RepID=A0ACC6PAM1_9BACL